MTRKGRSGTTRLARLSPDLEFEPVYNRLNFLRCRRMLFSMMEYNRQYKRTCVLLDRHPFIHEHHARATVHIDHMMVEIYQLFSLFARAKGNRLIRINPIERFGHNGMLPSGGGHPLKIVSFIKEQI